MLKVVSGTVLISSINAQESQMITQYSQPMISPVFIRASLIIMESGGYIVLDGHISRNYRKEFIIERLLFILENNVFCFNDEYF